ncbi:putative transcriptional regulator, MarR family protein [Micromonospora sonchi]|uniref:Transcriptional regulator, MarR family protein n=1 Tax=Micromonospora sonchi TaxID=1763543 RepID=A0A917U4P6_9ACTN|nr:MarR family transcriptional regulator [Micromonospora sonchi]GGM58356.1 putative transcriptional regulator, MarR family protein [Micromonospora sonchi]
MSAHDRLSLDPIAEARRQWAAHGWAAAADGMAAVTSLMRAQQIALARVEAVLRPYGVTFARYEVLMLLYFSRVGSLPMAKIGKRLQVHPTSVTNAVDRLESADLVRRTPHPTDRRTTLVELLPKGRELAATATEELNTRVFAAPGLPPENVTALVTILAELRHEAGDFSGPRPSSSDAELPAVDHQ